MSRLDLFIQRLLSQRDCIERAAELIGDRPGPILELGLGNGRSFDHLRARFPDREIYVFDRELASHPDSRPAAGYFIEGDFRETLPGAMQRLRAPAVLANCDIGSHNVAASRELAAAIAPLLAPLLAPGAVVLSDHEMRHPGWVALADPAMRAAPAYFMYRANG